MIYVLSDVHGNERRFNSIMKQIDLQPQDTLYVLGDVVDRNPGGIRLLRRIMAMPNAKNHSAWLAGEELRLTTYNRYDTEIRTSLRANVGSIFSDLQNKTSGAESKFEKTLTTQTSEFNRKV